jgi:hypothetical protein
MVPVQHHDVASSERRSGAAVGMLLISGLFGLLIL